jgi:two-component system OmpR family sensor kinase
MRRLLGSARARVLIAALALLAVTIAVSIVVDRAVLLARLDERIDRDLRQEVDEFRRLANGRDPRTGDAFGEDVAALFDVYLSNNVPSDDEVILTLLAGEPYARSADAPYPVEELAALVERWATTATSAYATDTTPAGPLRSLAVPVTDDDGNVGGTFVVGRFTDADRAEVDEAVRVASAVGAIAFLVAAAVAWTIAGRVLSPLRQLADATASIDERDLGTRIEVEGTGELADLAANFNAMLARVDRAFGSQRAFLDDAGHELRTPITIVRGHLELTPTDRPLPEATRSLVLDELDRMARIVDDLLTLAKAEQPGFLHLGPTDIGDLTHEVAAKARSLGERTWVVGSSAEVVVALDRHRIVQAWMNLVHNAVQHTTAGARIEVFSRLDRDRIELGVADSGEGVAPDDRERIFDRFTRGTSSQRTAADGAGLGLSIVTTIVAAHDGTLELRDTEGGGATFVMRLPLDDGTPQVDEEAPWPAS